ncbi:hypothetical protein [Rubellimicrobium sp. CFH 75288]|uniref:hypothetical protein n=1 Tax=Rubellimicrobium sp. CFH 75288 TaxID=2697034 RepID=UPI0014136DEB|nr:hypothetical protein [Rubellimicrobium sp. CFH 75288]NAZ36445.1 hypothetical protein [Rubellimicrobium sp. CFH 75288]
MTALTRYARLETTGLWRAEDETEPREVTVSLGHATLVLTDVTGEPVAHWSLPAVTRLNPGAVPARFGPDETGSESVEIEDDLMVSAIETVRRAVRRRQGGGRLRRGIAAGVAACLAGLLVLWLPGAVHRQALAVVPSSKRSEIGATLLGHLGRDLGTACRSALGVEALRRLHARLFGDRAAGQIVVLPRGPAVPLVLPGGLVILSRETVERAAEPAVLAGHVLAALAARRGVDPLDLLLQEAGVMAAARLLVTGDLPPRATEAHAQRLLTDPPRPPAPEALVPALATLGIPAGPYLRDADPARPLPATLPDAGEAPLITDAEWVSLQAICDG